MKVYVFRHGDVINPNNVLYGRLPGFHLSEQGKQDVHESASTLQGARIAHIISSPLERTLETSQIIAEVIGLPQSAITVDERLIEVDCRSWTGKSMDDFIEKSDYLADRRVQSATEPILDAGNRLLTVLTDHEASNENTIIVSHGDPIMGLVTLLTNDWAYIENHYIQKASYIPVIYRDMKWHLASDWLQEHNKEA